MMQAQCKGCTERRIGCHVTCEAYLAYAKEREAIRDARRQEGEARDRRSAEKLRNIRKKQILQKRGRR